MNAPLAFDWIDWMSPITHSFVLLKLLLLPGVAFYALHQRRKVKRTGIQPHESEAEASKPPRPLWINPSLAQQPAPPSAGQPGADDPADR